MRMFMHELFLQYFETEVIGNKRGWSLMFTAHPIAQLLEDDFIYAIRGCEKTKTTCYYCCCWGTNCITSINEEAISAHGMGWALRELK